MSFSPSFNTVSQCAHVGAGYFLVTAPVLAFHWPLWIVAGVVVLFAGAKEYYDCHGGETPLVAGDSWEDFFFWCVGIGLSALVLPR
jgi:hypothetical protein